MYKRIVLAYDGSESGQRALLDCNEFVQWAQAQLWLVAVMPLTATDFIGLDPSFRAPELEALEKTRYQDILAEGLTRLTAGGCAAKGELLVGESVHEIAKFAQEVDADLIVVGHKHLDSWAERWWRGSSSGKLIEQAPCSVLYVISP
jgi:nucleotide-binding universal stress UspA family protein